MSYGVLLYEPSLTSFDSNSALLHDILLKASRKFYERVGAYPRFCFISRYGFSSSQGKLPHNLKFCYPGEEKHTVTAEENVSQLDTHVEEWFLNIDLVDYLPKGHFILALSY